MSNKKLSIILLVFILASTHIIADSIKATDKKKPAQSKIKGLKLDPNDFIKLFDGKTLNGWKVLPGGEWKVDNRVIVGFQDKSEARHGMLISKKVYSDFIVKLKYKSIKGNSGFYFRAQRVNHAVSVKGFQAEIDSNGLDIGGIYETLDRAWIVRVPQEKVNTFYKKHDWNEMVVKAIGKNTTVYVNGAKTAELKNDQGLTKGHFGLQMHGGQDMHVEFKDIEIHDLSDDLDYTALKESGFTPMFNGRDLTGWQTTGNWIVKDNNVVTLKPRPGEHGWKRYADYLTTTRQYDNFVLKLEFKFEKTGNSGVFMRVGNLKDHVKYGFELQILDSHHVNKPTSHDCGGIVSLVNGPTKNMVKPAGQWNEYIVYLKDNRLKVTLNGKQINDLDISKTKIKDRPAKGYISFQDEGKPVWYRNVRIREIIRHKYQ